LFYRNINTFDFGVFGPILAENTLFFVFSRKVIGVGIWKKCTVGLYFWEKVRDVISLVCTVGL